MSRDDPEFVLAENKSIARSMLLGVKHDVLPKEALILYLEMLIGDIERYFDRKYGGQEE